MDSTLAALLGAIIGGLLSVVASWLAQRVQTKGQWLSQEIQRRQQLSSEFVEAAARCFGEALQKNELNTGRLAKLYGIIGRIRLLSSEAVVKEANRIAHRILSASRDANQTKIEIGEFLSRDSIDLFSDFSDACRAELARLQPHRGAESGPLGYRLTPIDDVPTAQTGQDA